jgi:hypothetical protein
VLGGGSSLRALERQAGMSYGHVFGIANVESWQALRTAHRLMPAGPE